MKTKILLCCLLLLASLLFLIFTGERVSRQHRERAVMPFVTASAAEFDVPVAMILAVIRSESDFHHDATSPVGAKGLMQLMPQTFSWLCDELQEPLGAEKITDPETNVRFGTYYLSYLLKKFGSWRVALAAYNAGEGRVSEWLNDPSLALGGTLRRIPYPETAAYVEKTLRYYTDYLQDHP